MKVHKINITTLPIFWITTDLDEKTLKTYVKNFDYKLGRYGYIQKSVRLKRNDIFAFMETIKEFNSKIVYRNAMHRELLIRERNNGWLRRRLAEHGINVPQNTVARWISNFFMPTPQTKAKVEEILEFEWV